MDKSKNKKMSSKKKILIAFLLAIILLIVTPYVTRPILDQIDHDRFKQLDKQIGIIYDEIKVTSDKSDNWKYTKECSGEFNGWFWARTNGDFACKAIISLDKSVTSAKEVADLQAKYFPIFDKSKNLKENSSLSIPTNFGVDFVVGSAEKHYIETNTNIKCWYVNQVYQKIENHQTMNYTYGSAIDGNEGNIQISLKCSDKSRSYWYEPDEDLQKTLRWVYGPDFK